MTRRNLGIVAVVAIVGLSALGLVLSGSAKPSATSGAETAARSEDQSGNALSGLGLAPAPVVNPRLTAARITLSVAPLAKADRGYSLTARVLTPDGKPVGDTTVKYYELVEIFGQREMLLGAATTDGRGDALVSYLPARQGTHAIVVRSAAQGRVTAAEGRLVFDADRAAAQRRSERSALAIFSDKVPYAVGALVLLVWGLIAFAFFDTARGVIGGARGPSHKEGPA